MDSVFKKLLRPLAKLAMARGVRFTELAEHLKRAYVDVARSQTPSKVPMSRMSVMTGLQRRDIARLMLETDEQVQKRPNALSKLVALWLAQRSGAPLSHHGEIGSFDALAREIRRDVHPRSMLDELVAAGTVSLEGGFVHLLKHAYVPLKGSEAQLDYLGNNVGDHLAVAVGNVLGDPPGFERSVHYNKLTTEAVQALEAKWQIEMERVLEAVNAKALTLQDQEQGSAHFRAGGYFRGEKEE